MKALSYTQEMVPLPDWNCKITLIFAAEGVYAVLHELCAVLGVSNSRDQAAKLKNHPLTAIHVTDRFDVQTAAGKRKPYCLHIDGISDWLITINPNKVRPEFKSGLLNFQAAVSEAARRILYGMVNDPSRKIIYLAERLGKADVVIPDEEEDE